MQISSGNLTPRIRFAAVLAAVQIPASGETFHWDGVDARGMPSTVGRKTSNIWKRAALTDWTAPGGSRPTNKVHRGKFPSPRISITDYSRNARVGLLRGDVKS